MCRLKNQSTRPSLAPAAFSQVRCAQQLRILTACVSTFPMISGAFHSGLQSLLSVGATYVTHEDTSQRVV